MYRSVSSQHIAQDESFVNQSVREGVVPETVRYGIMERGTMKAYRGVVKSTQGEMFYFNWHDGGKFKLVPVNACDPKHLDERQWEANKLFKSCQFGCDLIRSGDAAPMVPTAPGANPPMQPLALVQDPEEENEVDKAGELPGAAVAPVSEEAWMADQARMRQEVHPGAAGTQTPDDPAVGRDWHNENENIALAQNNVQDGLQPLATNDGEKHWNTADLLKSWGVQLQETAPRVLPQATGLEHEYMQTVLNMPTEQVQKGVALAPRHRHAFEQWKSERLRGRLSKLSEWTRGNG